MNIKNEKEYPTSIFKYCHLNNNNHMDNFIKNQIWLSNPLNFNDPYDCDLPFDYDCSKEEVHNFFIDIRHRYSSKPVNEIFTNLPDNWEQMDEEDIIENLAEFNSHNEDSLKEHAEPAITSIIEKMGVFCLSKDPSNTLMWSHYSKKHTGVCLMFDIESDIDLFTDPIKIQYKEKYKKFNLIREGADSPEFKQYFFGIKSSDWAYEKEIRFIKKQKRLYSFKPMALKGIIFGLNTSDIDSKCIKNYCMNSEKYSHIKFHNAKQVDGIFDIEY